MLEEAKQELAAGADGAATGTGLGAAFRRVGWLGFWLQIIVALAPIAIVAVIFGAVRGFGLPGGRMGLLSWFSLLSVALLLFTTFWSWRYVRIGRGLETGGPADAAGLSKTIWTGLGASALGILFSIIVMTAEIVYLLIVFLEAPQGGAPVFQTVDGGGPSWISAVDILSMLTLVLTVAAEIVVLLLALWLLFRISGATRVGRKAKT